jgi:hypothetical protein
MTKWIVIGGVALAVVIIARRAMAGERDTYDPGSWSTLPGYRQGSGVML